MLANSSVLPYPYFNALTVFTSGFLLFWFLWALFRFIDVIRIRVAILSNKLIPIRGINHYLMTFNEIVSQSHINSIIHTRQSNPPKAIKSLYLPFALDSVSVNHGPSKVQGHGHGHGLGYTDKRLEIRLWSSNHCKVYLLFDFHTYRMKDLLKVNGSITRELNLDGLDGLSENNETTNNTNESTSPRDRRHIQTPTFAQFNSYLTSIWTQSSYDSIQRLVDFGVCREIYYAGSFVEGAQDISCALPRFACDDSTSRIGILIISDSHNHSGSNGSTLKSWTTRSNRDSHDHANSSSSQNTSSNNHNNHNTDSSSNNSSPNGKNHTSGDIESQSLTSEYLNPIVGKTKRSSRDFTNIGTASIAPVDRSGTHRGKDTSSSSGSFAGLEVMGFALCVVTGSTVTPATTSTSTASTVSSSSSRKTSNTELIVTLPPGSFNSSFGEQNVISGEHSPKKHATMLNPTTSVLVSSITATESTNIKSSFTLSDCFIHSKNGSIYSAQEIFGWKGSKTHGSTSNGNNGNNGHRGRDGNTSHGNSMRRSSSRQNVNDMDPSLDDSILANDDECVVCLTEKKDIALLPCRHLCVCRQCLSHIDKCPVCRATFDEYVAISSSDKATIQIPFHVKSV